MKAIQKEKNVFAYSPCTCFAANNNLVSGVQCDIEKMPHAVVCWTLSSGKCRDSCGHHCAD